MFTIQQRDSTASSHPISVEVNKPSEISSIFDDISYGKGGSVIRMVNYFVGNDTFYRGISVVKFFYFCRV
jgi:tricorn protease interacting factor F2/3